MEYSTPSTNQEIAYAKTWNDQQRRAQLILNTKKDGKEEEDWWLDVQTAKERTYARKNGYVRGTTDA